MVRSLTAQSPAPTSALSSRPSSASAAALTPDEAALFGQALDRAEALHRSTESAVLGFGQWLFDQVFGGDSTATIEHRGDSALWAAIAAAADSPRLRLRLDLIERAVLCAAYDRRLNQDAWRSLDFARKSRLLRLGDEKLLRKAAAHVLTTNLSTVATEVYVRAVLREQGEPVDTRVSVTRVQSQLDKLSERFEGKDFVRRLEAAAKRADTDERGALLESLDRAERALQAARARLKKR